MRTFLVVAVGLSFLLGGLPARADQVTLTNGDRLTGRILELNAEELRLETDLLGEITVPRKIIASLSADQQLAVTLPDGRIARATLTPQDSQVEVQTDTERTTVALGELQALRTPEGQEKYEQSLHPRWNQNWQLGVDFALSARGGGGTTRTTLGVDATRYTLNDELTLSYQSLLEQEARGAVTNDDKIRAAADYLRRLSDSLYYFGATDFDYDALQNLNLRAVLAGGLGWRMKESQKLVFDLIGGGAFNQEFFQEEAPRRSPEGLVGERLRWQIGPRAKFEERLALFPNLSDPGEYRVRVTTSLEVRINTWLSWQLNYSTHFLSDPPPQTKRNDSLVTSGLRLSFGRDHESRMKLLR